MIGQVWRSTQHTWRCVATLYEIRPGEQLRAWECISGPARERGRIGHFGDRFVRRYWTRQYAERAVGRAVQP